MSQEAIQQVLIEFSDLKKLSKSEQAGQRIPQELPGLLSPLL